jgi:hypothetical protein
MDTWNTISPVVNPVIQVASFVLPIVGCFFGNPEPAVAEMERVGPSLEQKAATIGSEIASTSESIAARASSAISEAVAPNSSKALVPWVDPAGRPPNFGAIGSWTTDTPAPGTIISRIGLEGGRYASPNGTPIEMRSLSPGSQGLPESTYRIANAFTVQKSFAAPWYNQFGFGTQYFLPAPIDQLVAEGYLDRISK